MKEMMDVGSAWLEAEAQSSLAIMFLDSRTEREGEISYMIPFDLLLYHLQPFLASRLYNSEAHVCEPSLPLLSVDDCCCNHETVLCQTLGRMLHFQMCTD